MILDLSWTLLLVYVVTATLTYLFFHSRKAIYKSPLRQLPGPWYSTFTELWLIFQEFSGNRRSYIHKLHEKFGSVIRLGPSEVSFTSADAVREIYTNGGSGYDKTELYTMFMQFGVRTMFSTLSKAGHSQKKRHIAGSYSNTNIMRDEVLGGIRDRTDAFVKRCTEIEGQSIDIYVYLHCFALDCATIFLFNPYGTHSIEGDPDLKIMQELSYHNALQLFLFQYRCPKFIDWLMKVTKIQPAPLSRKYVFKACSKSDPAESTLLHKLQNSKPSIHPTEIAAECMDDMAAGTDTVGDALCFLMYQISLPDYSYIQVKLFREFANHQDAPLDRLEYLNAVLMEALRCFPPIPMSQPRYVPKGGRTIDGYFIPEGTIVSCQAYSVHRLNRSAFPDGNKFIPERWLEPSLTFQMNRHFFAFGAGSRGCTGKYLAMTEMRYLLKGVYSRYRTNVAENMIGRMEIADQIISSRPRDQTCNLVFEEL